MLKDEIKKKINHKQKGSKEKKRKLKNKEQILKKKKQIRGWIILDLKAKLKKNQFHKRIKEKTTKRMRSKSKKYTQIKIFD